MLPKEVGPALREAKGRADLVLSWEATLLNLQPRQVGVQPLPLGELRLLQLLDVLAQPLDLGFLQVEFVKVALVGGGGGRHLFQVGPQPGLVLGDLVELLAGVGQVTLGVGQGVLLLANLPQASLTLSLATGLVRKN